MSRGRELAMLGRMWLLQEGGFYHKCVEDGEVELSEVGSRRVV